MFVKIYKYNFFKKSRFLLPIERNLVPLCVLTYNIHQLLLAKVLIQWFCLCLIVYSFFVGSFCYKFSVIELLNTSVFL